MLVRFELTWKEKQDEKGVTTRVPKARCVLMGHAGNDDRLTETYAGTPDSSLFRLLLVLTVIQSWYILQSRTLRTPFCKFLSKRERPRRLWRRGCAGTYLPG